MNQLRHHPADEFRGICSIPFWLRAPFLFFASCVGSALLAWYLPQQAYIMEWRVSKYFETSDLLLVAGSVFTLVIGFWVGSFRSQRLLPLPVEPDPILGNLAVFASVITYFGYAAWFGLAAFRGLRPWHVYYAIFGNDLRFVYSLRTGYMETVSGVTTTTQFGIAAVLLCSLAFWNQPKIFRWLVYPLVILSVLRAVLNSERLSILELIIPLGIMWLRLNLFGRPVSRLTLLRLMILPFVVIAAVFILFVGMESLRSWQHYRQSSDSLLEFAALRFGGYYITSMNNGALLLDHPGDQPLPYYTIEWFWRLPLISNIISYEQITGIQPLSEFHDMLVTYANPEFNNPGGFFVILTDLGMIGGLSLIFFLGIVSGVLYTSFVLGRLSGLLFYPTVIMCGLEMPRFFYYGSHRNLPSLLFLFLTILLTARLFNHRAEFRTN